ncbi:MAG: hypothetical protein LUH41_07450 [Clostridiales bacterium]|nr:hypothetical protein [Clostridiales bacterium]
MEQKKKADGFKYDFTPSELKTLLFHSKRCQDCGRVFPLSELARRANGSHKTGADR